MSEIRPRGTFVVVSGPPASGKSTLAPRLAARLGLPLIAKDAIKEAIATWLPPANVEGSMRVGRAAVAAMLAVAAQSGSAVLESVWHRSRAVADLQRLPGSVIEVYCSAPVETMRVRYRQRAAGRVRGHFDDDRTDGSLWHPDNTGPVAGGWPVIEIDTTAPVDIVTLHESLVAVAPDLR